MREKRVRAKSLAKGVLAGLVGGLVATAAKRIAERVYPPTPHDAPEPPERLAAHELMVIEKTRAAEAVQWGFGAVAGAAYGALVEYYPAATAKDGAGFGVALVTLTHEGALPTLGLAAQPGEQTERERRSEMASHVVFGVVTETVRRAVRWILG